MKLGDGELKFDWLDFIDKQPKCFMNSEFIPEHD